jgi:hypothetical protein
MEFEYKLTVFSRKDAMGNKRKPSYFVEFDAELKNKFPVALQKRRARKIAEEHYGCPVKNPTQKRYVYEHYFSETREQDGGWFIEITPPFFQTYEGAF